MCGITGIYGAGKADPRRLKAGMDALIHRGPDGEGFWFSADGKTGIGHRRLSIVGLSAGAQPIVSEDGKKAVAVNGEFYGHREIRRDLEARGHVFRTCSDSEIVLHLYEEYGVECLKYLRGEFAFILRDDEKDTLFAARDRFGIKPLCYAEYNGALVLASEAKALFAMGVPAKWDDAAFFHSAQLQYTQPDRTLFKNVLQLKPGHFLIAKQGVVQTSCYWDMDYPVEEMVCRSGDDAVSEFSVLFEESVALRLQADVDVCFHLSGGLDSSAVLGVAAARMSFAPHAFTVTFDHEGYNECAIAEETAEHLGAVFHPVHVTQDDLVHHLPEAVFHGEGLAINGHLTAKYLLNKAIRRGGFKVALTGEGADEVLAGYPHLRQDLFRLNKGNEAAAAQLEVTNGMSAGIQIAFGERLPTGAVEKALGYVPAFLEAKAAMGRRTSGVLSEDFKNDFSGNDSYADLISGLPVSSQLAGRHVVSQSSYIWSKTALANYILRTLGDAMEMSASVEGRLPFLDHVLFDFLRRLPVNLKIQGAVEKYILREGLKKRLTPRVYKRQKHPFMAPPVSRFAKSALSAFIGDSLSSKGFSDLRFFDQKKAMSLLDRLPSMPDQERTATEPVLMMMLTAHLLQERMRLS